jgi:hypothetical protein
MACMPLPHVCCQGNQPGAACRATRRRGRHREGLGGLDPGGLRDTLRAGEQTALSAMRYPDFVSDFVGQPGPLPERKGHAPPGPPVPGQQPAGPVAVLLEVRRVARQCGGLGGLRWLVEALQE